MNEDVIVDSQKLSNHHKEQRDSARAERDFALEERDLARSERDGFENDNAAQEQFVATVSHDLRNPMGVIKMAIEALQMGLSPDEEKAMIDMIDRSADQASELISQLLDTHLIRSGEKLPLHFGRCEISAILSKCHQSLTLDDQKRIVIRPDPMGEAWGNWDPRALERAFKNLISNALKFSDADKTIQLSFEQTSEVTTISFQNFGEVIALGDQIKIFDSHFRIQNSNSRNKKGWGLGLTLVKGIAEAHNGKVEVISSRSAGTTFIIKLPNDR